MITWKCLYKLDKEELAGIVNDIKNGEKLYCFLDGKILIQQI